MNKKAQSSSFYMNYLEVSFIVFIILGFLLGLIGFDPLVNYMVVFLSGIFIGRQFYFYKSKNPFGRYALGFAFLIGYLIGSYNVNLFVVLFLFFLGTYVGYKLYTHHLMQEYL